MGETYVQIKNAPETKRANCLVLFFFSLRETIRGGVEVGSMTFTHTSYSRFT